MVQQQKRSITNNILRNKRLRCAVMGCALLLSTAFLYGQSAGRYGGPLLRISPHARQVAMGGAFTALANDYNLLRYNVGGLGYLRKVKMSMNFHNWIGDTKQGNLEIALPSRYGVGGFGLTYFSEGQLNEVNRDFRPTGNVINSNDLMLSFGYGAFMKVKSHTLSFGVGGKVIRQDLAGMQATGVGMDVGTILILRHLSLGLTAQNITLGQFQFGDSKEALPETYRGGLAVRLPVGSDVKLNLAADLAKVRRQDGLLFAAGTELKVSNLLSLRGGYKFHDMDASRWGAGFGLTIPMEWMASSSTDIDYSFSPLDAFDAFVHRFSFTFTFGVVQPVKAINQLDTERFTEYQRGLEDELRATREARLKMEQATADVEARAQALEEEWATRLTRIQQIALTTAGKIEVVPDVNDSTRILVSLRINFDFDQSVIRPAEHETMEKVADILNTYPGAQLLMAGHTDNVGESNYNMHLSQRRMDSVMSYLIEKNNIRAERFFMPIAYGESRPLESNSTQGGRERNRRVEFTILTDNSKAEVPAGTAIMSIQALNANTFAIICNGRIENFKQNYYDNNTKYVLDFPGIFDLSSQKNYDLLRGIVQRARIGYHPNGQFTRVVFDLSEQGEFIADVVDNIVTVTLR